MATTRTLGIPANTRRCASRTIRPKPRMPIRSTDSARGGGKRRPRGSLIRRRRSRNYRHAGISRPKRMISRWRGGAGSRDHGHPERSAEARALHFARTRGTLRTLRPPAACPLWPRAARRGVSTRVQYAGSPRRTSPAD